MLVSLIYVFLFSCWCLFECILYTMLPGMKVDFRGCVYVCKCSIIQRVDCEPWSYNASLVPHSTQHYSSITLHDSDLPGSADHGSHRES